MSKERTPGGSSFEKTESKLSRNERRIRTLFGRAGWDKIATRGERHQVIRDEFQDLFVLALIDEDSPYDIHEILSQENDSYTISIKIDDKTIAAKTTYNHRIPGEISTAYNIVRQTVSWRKDLVFQLLEYSPTKTKQTAPLMNIGYYLGEGQAEHIISDYQ